MKALGIVEMNSIAKGIETADIMAKAASVSIVFAKHVCPGKFVIMITGEVGEIEESVKEAKRLNLKFIMDWLVLPNAHKALMQGLCFKNVNKRIEALGCMEFTNIVSGIKSLDTALKAADVVLIRITIGTGIGGKSYYIISGSLSCVEAAINEAVKSIDSKKIISSVVIPSPDKELISSLI